MGRTVPTAAARVRVLEAREVCGGQSGIGQVFSEYFGFPCQSFHQFLYHNNGTIGLLVAAVPSGPNWTSPPNIPI
jgi:hypothetical protein